MNHHYQAILDVMGRADLKEAPRFLARTARVQNFEAVDGLIEGWAKPQKRDDVAPRMRWSATF